MLIIGVVSATTAFAGQPTHQSALSKQQKAAALVAQGKATLVNDPLSAYRLFKQAHRTDPQNAEATFYLAVTRALSWTARHRTELSALGFTGPDGSALTTADLNPFQFLAVAPQVVQIPQEFAQGADVQQFLRKEALSEAQASAGELASVPSGFLSLLPIRNPLTGTPAIEIDDADVALFRAMAALAIAELHLAQVYDVNVDTQDLADRIQQHAFGSPSAWLDTYPTAFRIQDASQALQAKEALLEAIDAYLAASEALRTETDDQTDDLISFSSAPEDRQREAAFRAALRQLRTSLTGLSDAAWTLTLDQGLHLGDFFDRPVDLRSLEQGNGIQDALRKYVLYQSGRALANLHKAPTTFSESIDPSTLGIPSQSSRIVEVDYGDLLGVQAALHGLNATVALLSSYDAGVDAGELAEAATQPSFDVNASLLSRYPNALRVQALNHLADARAEGLQALHDALDASEYLRFLDDGNQQDDVFRLEGTLAQLEAHWRPQIEALQQSLQATIDPSQSATGDEVLVNLNPIFDVPLDPRGLLPQFDGSSPVPGTWPDPTLGGVLPDFTQQDWQ